jgi:hypothetical protein
MAMMTAEIQSSPATTATTATGTITASTTWGRYREKYPSRASVPDVASTAKVALFSVRNPAGPASAIQSTTVDRKADLARADARWAARSVPQPRAARPNTTTRRRTTGTASRSRPWCLMKAPEITSASSHAWVMTSKAVAPPSTTDTTRKRRVARA